MIIFIWIIHVTVDSTWNVKKNSNRNFFFVNSKIPFFRREYHSKPYKINKSKSPDHVIGLFVYGCTIRTAWEYKRVPYVNTAILWTQEMSSVNIFSEYHFAIAVLSVCVCVCVCKYERKKKLGNGFYYFLKNWFFSAIDYFLNKKTFNKTPSEHLSAVFHNGFGLKYLDRDKGHWTTINVTRLGWNNTKM